jgi:hypothetical protein
MRQVAPNEQVNVHFYEKGNDIYELDAGIFVHKRIM